MLIVCVQAGGVDQQAVPGRKHSNSEIGFFHAGQVHVAVLPPPLKPLRRSVCPTVVAGAETRIANEARPRLLIASGTVQPPWLPPCKPTLFGSTPGHAARKPRAAEASSAYMASESSVGNSPG